MNFNSNQQTNANVNAQPCKNSVCGAKHTKNYLYYILQVPSDTDHVNFPDSSIYNRIATTPATPSNSPLATFNPLAEPVAEALGAGIVVEVGGAPDGAILVVVVFA